MVSPPKYTDRFKITLDKYVNMILIMCCIAAIFQEERRIDVLRKRQEKDFGKIVEREQVMINLQLKIKRVEDDDIKKKKIHEKKVADLKNEASKKNLIRLHDIVLTEKKDADRKKELARKDQEFDQKMKLQALEAEKKLAREVLIKISFM